MYPGELFLEGNNSAVRVRGCRRQLSMLLHDGCKLLLYLGIHLDARDRLL